MFRNPVFLSMVRMVVASVVLLGAGQAVAGGGSGFTGLEVQSANRAVLDALGAREETGGLLVRALLPDGPGAQAGLRPGDLLVGFQGTPVLGVDQMVSYMQTTEPGQTVTLTRWTPQGQEPVAVTLGPWPEGWRFATESLVKLSDPGLLVRALTAQARQDHGIGWGRLGVVVRDVDEGSPAAEAGLHVNDLITAWNGTPVVSPEALQALAEASQAAGDAWFARVERGNRLLALGPAADQATLPAPSALPPTTDATHPATGVRVASLSHELRQIYPIRWDSRGVVVVDAPDAVQHRGLRVGDIITAVGAEAVAEPADLIALLDAPHPLDGDGRKADRLLIVERPDGFVALIFGLAPADQQGALHPTLLNWPARR